MREILLGTKKGRKYPGLVAGKRFHCGSFATEEAGAQNHKP